MEGLVVVVDNPVLDVTKSSDAADGVDPVLVVAVVDAGRHWQT